MYKQAEERKLESECCSQNRYQLAFLKGDTAQMAQLAAHRHGQAGHGRPAAGRASGHGRLVRKVEERARADPARDGFSPAQRRQETAATYQARQRCARWNRATGSRHVLPMPMRR